MAQISQIGVYLPSVLYHLGQRLFLPAQMPAFLTASGISSGDVALAVFDPVRRAALSDRYITGFA
jgi:hypothetical protein